MLTLAIIGGGAAGVSALYQLIEYYSKHSIDNKPKVVLIEKNKIIGPGLAYSIESDDSYLLNIASTHMSPIPNKPDHFINWLNDTANIQKWRPAFPELNIKDSEYLPRKLFGLYLADLAVKTQEKAKLLGIDVEFIHGEVINILLKENYTSEFSIELEGSETLSVNSALLCIGHLPTSQASYQEFSSISGYHKTPWSLVQNEIPIDRDIIILGTRLTAIDSILSRAKYIQEQVEQGHKGQVGKIVAVSRMGLLPRVISDVTPGYVREKLTLEKIDTMTAYGTQKITLRELKKLFKAEIKCAYEKIKSETINFKVNKVLTKNLTADAVRLLEHEIKCAQKNERRPWQTVLFSLYPIVPRLWEALEEEGKKEFLDKYYSFWMTCLAAFPVDNAKKILDLLKNGSLEIHSGLESITYKEEAMDFNIELKNGRTLSSKYVVNATGQGHDINQTDSTLLKNLLLQKIILPHTLGGIEVDFKSLRVHSKFDKLPLFIIGDSTWGACMATADLSQIVNNQIPRAINSMLKPFIKKNYSTLITKHSTIISDSSYDDSTSNINKDSIQTQSTTNQIKNFL
jgi:uncharacterized NAD(P)/FAD-binding protein YdhS